MLQLSNEVCTTCKSRAYTVSELDRKLTVCNDTEYVGQDVGGTSMGSLCRPDVMFALAL